MRINEPCPGCKKNIDFTNEYATFNIKAALEFIKDGREIVETPVAELLKLTEKAKIYPRHIFHVDSTVPIILATAQGASFPIDGLHRIARAHQEKKVLIKAHLLTEEETKTIIINKINLLT